MTTPVAFDVVVVPFPYSDRLAEKRRPALVVSSAALTSEHGLLWVAMITSQVGSPRAGDVPIQNLGLAGLPAPSLVRAAKLATIEPSRVLRTAGRLTAADAAQVRVAMARYAAN